MLVLRGLQLSRIIRKLSGRYRLLSVNVVKTTNNLPSIVVIEKLAVDEVRTSVKRQLGYLAQFVNVSSEMYNALNYEKIDEKTLQATKTDNFKVFIQIIIIYTVHFDSIINFCLCWGARKLLSCLQHHHIHLLMNESQLYDVWRNRLSLQCATDQPITQGRHA